MVKICIAATSQSCQLFMFVETNVFISKFQNVTPTFINFPASIPSVTYLSSHFLNLQLSSSCNQIPNHTTFKYQVSSNIYDSSFVCPFMSFSTILPLQLQLFRQCAENEYIWCTERVHFHINNFICIQVCIVILSIKLMNF